jgi:N-acetylmuramoyl-L-alanine amidase
MSASPTNANLGLNHRATAMSAVPLLFPHSYPAGPPGHDALQALLAFSSLHDQILRQTRGAGLSADTGRVEQFVLDEVLQLVAERALALTGANGVAIALAEGEAIICRASAGEIAPDKRAKLNPNSGFSGACFRTGQIIRCDDTENDPRVNVQAARRLGTRSMVAVPLAGRRGAIGLLEAFSNRAYGFNDSSIRSLNLLAELILAAMKPEEQSLMADVSEQVTIQAVAESETITAAPSAESVPTAAVTPDLPVAVKTEASATEISAPVYPEPSLLIEPATASHPGLKIVLLLVLMAIAVGAGVWWSLRQSQGKPVNNSAVTPVQSPQSSQPTSGVIEQTSEQKNADGLTTVTGIRHWSSPNSSTVVIDLQNQVQYEQHRISDPDRIYFDLHDTELAHSLAGKNIEVGDSLLIRVRVAQLASGVTRIVLDTKNNPAYSVSLKQDPYRIEVQVHRADASVQPRAKADLFGPATPPLDQLAASKPHTIVVPSPLSLAQAEKIHVKPQVPKFRIALDAGHGGWDEGTIGRRGLMEKDLALDVVARLGKLVTDRLGAEVIYTRRDDTYIPLEKRAEIANLAQADFFVSIHANYSDLPSARGVETYYANTYSSLNARTPQADATVQTVNWTNVDIREKALQSQRLAVSVQKALFGKMVRDNSGLRNRGVKKASYVVLTGTTMPAILTEVSFVSSPADEKILKSAAYRQQIAEALYKGIAGFTSDAGKVTLASTSGKPSGR